MKALVATLLCLGLFTACTDQTEPNTTVEPQPASTSISGQVLSGSGDGEVKLNIAGKLFKTAPVDQNGQFQLALPGEAELSGTLLPGQDILSSLGCTGQVQSSEAGAQGVGFKGLWLSRGALSAQVYNADASLKLIALPPHAEFTAYVYVYAQQNTLLSGNIDCTKVLDVPQVAQVDVAVNAKLRQGWNVLRLQGQTTNLSSPYKAEALLVTLVDEWGKWLTAKDLSQKVS